MWMKMHGPWYGEDKQIEHQALLGGGEKRANCFLSLLPPKESLILKFSPSYKVFIKRERHESVGGGEKRAKGYFSLLPPKEGLILELCPSFKVFIKIERHESVQRD